MRLLVMHSSRAPVLLVDLALMKAQFLSVASIRTPACLMRSARSPIIVRQLNYENRPLF
jgi:hypothetical protein